MTLDKEKLARIVKDQLIGTLLLKKKYEEVACERDAKGELLRVGMKTVDFLSHFTVMNDLIDKWQPTEIPDSHIPALVVTPFSVVSFEEQVKKMELEGNPGIAEFSENKIQDLEDDIPREPYLLIDVDPISLINPRDYTAENVKEFFKVRRDRHPLTVNEGFALVTLFPDTLPDYSPHVVELFGSRYIVGAHRFTSRPFLARKRGPEQILLSVSPTENMYNQNWIVPSCSQRINPRKY